MNFTQKKLNTPKMTREIEDFGISKYENKIFSKFTWRKAHTPFPHLWKLHTNFFEDPQNDKKKIKDPRTSNLKTSKY